MQTKLCAKCGETKTVDMFAKSRCKSGISNLCRSCHNQSKLEWSKNNKDKRRESLAKHYDANYKKIIERAKIWKLENPLKVKKSGAKRYIKNKDRMLSMNKEWNRINSVKMRSYCAARRARLKSCNERFTNLDVDHIYTAQKGRCAYCKAKVGNRYHVDHIVPMAKGGRNRKDNLQICCPTCNLKKSAKDPIDFAQELGLLI